MSSNQYMCVKTSEEFYVKQDMMVHTCNPSTWEAGVRGSQIQGQPRV
jgi:hypothetical protein